ncbi:MAG: hypothetical protein AB1765_08870 [Candidatus Hydrogenedentota bacterium]
MGHHCLGIELRKNWQLFKDKRGFSPWYLAYSQNRDDLEILMIRHGADINERTEENYTALHEAVDQGCFEEKRKDLTFLIKIN